MRGSRYLSLLSVSLMMAACGGGGGGGGTPPTPEVTFPQAGAVLRGTQTITWVSPANPATVEIRLSNDSGQSFGTQIAASAPDNGMFVWDTTTVADGSSYRIALTPMDGNGATGGAFSNAADFAVDNTAPTIVLNSPQAGDVFGGEQARVTWTTTDSNPGTVEIRLSDDSGATFPTVIAAAAPDTGAFVFDSRGFTEGTTYRIQVLPTDLAGNVGGADASSGDAEMDNTIPSVTLTSPDGGELLASLHDIVYTMTDMNPDHVEIFLSSDSGLTYPEAITLNAPVVGPFQWNTALHPDGTTYRVRVIGVDEAGNRSQPADSSADFALENIVLKQSAFFLDEDMDGTLNAGDRLFLAFNEEIVFNSPSTSDFQTFVTGDTLGSGGTLTDENLVGEMSITLGSGASFRARGEFDPDQVTAGSPSGIDVAAMITPDAIENVLGTDVAPIGGVDIVSGFVQARDEAGSDRSTSCDAGDLDGDGDIDFVIGRDGSLGVALRVRNGLGEYPLSGNSPVGTDDVRDVALGDIDGDGDLDLITGVVGANRVYTNDGTGAFTDTLQLLGTGITLSVALGDLDGDGDLDLVSGNDFSTPVRTYTNDGTGVFSPTLENLGGFDTTDLALGDVDGDGDLDVLAGNKGNNVPNEIWVNDGSGGFTLGSAVLTTQTTRVGLGDIDGDGDLDAVIAVTGQNEVSFNDGQGNFGPTAQVFSNGDHRGLALHDFDEDGDLDALLTKFTDRDELWLNDGAGLFERMPQNIGNSPAVDVAIGDFDGDGDTDYFAPGGLPSDDIVWSNSVSGVFGPITLTAGPAVDPDSNTTRAALALDANGDGRMDVVVARASVGVQLLLGAGDGTFGAPSALAGPAPTGDATLVPGDFNSDGRMDLYYLAASQGDSLLINNGMGGFSAQANTIDSTGSLRAATGDLNGDGHLDLYLGVLSGDDLIYLGDGAGDFTLSTETVSGVFSSTVSLFDFDKDGDLDVFLGTNNGARFATNDGSGAFTLNGATLGTNSHTSVRAGDIDRDGDLDVVSLGDGTAPSETWLSNGAGGFTAGTTFAAGDVGASLELYDYNHDGQLDVLAALDGGSGFDAVILLGNVGSFATTGQTLGSGVRSHAIADFDRDGDPDVFEGRSSASDVLWSN